MCEHMDTDCVCMQSHHSTYVCHMSVISLQGPRLHFSLHTLELVLEVQKQASK